MRYWQSLSAALLALVIAGCSESKTPAPAASAPPASPVPAPAQPPPPQPTPPPVVEDPEVAAFQKLLERRPRPERVTAEPIMNAEGPDEVIVQLGKAIAEKKYQALWEILPTSYQEELRKTVTDFAHGIDGQTWNELTTIVQYLVVGMEKQKELFFAHPVSEQFPMPKDKLEAAWDPIHDVGEALLGSQLYDIEDLKTFDFPSFLASTMPTIAERGTALLEIFPVGDSANYLKSIDDLKNVTASKISGDDSEAIVKVELEGQDPVELTMVRVESKWIPKELQEHWPDAIKHIKEMMAVIPPASDEEKSKKFKGQLGILKIGAMSMMSKKDAKQFDGQVRFLWKLAMNQDFPVPPEGEAKPKPDDAKPSAEEKAEPKP